MRMQPAVPAFDMVSRDFLPAILTMRRDATHATKRRLALSGSTIRACEPTISFYPAGGGLFAADPAAGGLTIFLSFWTNKMVQSPELCTILLVQKDKKIVMLCTILFVQKGKKAVRPPAAGPLCGRQLGPWLGRPGQEERAVDAFTQWIPC